MVINNKLNKSFGPVGAFSGTLVFVAGLCSIYFSYYALILIFIGAFVGFSYSSTFIDFDNKRVRFSNNIFGVIKTGQWLNIESSMKIGIKKSKKVWRSYSGGNRTLDIVNEDFILSLYDSKGKELMPVKKADSLDFAKSELDKICRQLEISQF
jgi:hypothetical protein